MPPPQCSTEGCRAILKKRQRYKAKDGGFVCGRCFKASAAVVHAIEEASRREAIALKKEQELDAAIRVETAKRLQLESKITDRLFKQGGYKMAFLPL